LDLAAMRQAAAFLEGTHDFAAFSANPHREIGGTVRTLWRLSVRKQGSLVTISAVGDGFLYKMVRSLAGHLLRVGKGAISADETPALLESKLRTARVETAPAQGLCLWKIHYRAIPGLPKPGPVC
jgi:tRNA pseudouridine38-40 synthase